MPGGGRATRLRVRPRSGWRLLACVVGLVLVGSVLVVVAGAAARDAGPGPPAGPPDVTAGGVPVGDPAADVTVDVYLDFGCPACRAYHREVDALLDGLVAQGTARVVYHPVAYLDGASTTQYSSRAAAASGCAAEAGVFATYVDLLLAVQPVPPGPGLSDERLVALGRQAGGGPAFARCVREGRYVGWVEAATAAARQAGIAAVPAVFVEGGAVPRTADALRQAVDVRT